jgi:hypothetical protein
MSVSLRFFVRRFNSGVTEALQWCYSGVMALQRCYSGITPVLQRVPYPDSRLQHPGQSSGLGIMISPGIEARHRTRISGIIH